MTEPVKRNWDPRSMLDISDPEKQAIMERAAMKRTLKAEWQKKVTNPHMFSGDGFHHFDPAIKRFDAMHATTHKFWKPTRTSALYLLCFSAAVALTTYEINWTKADLERRLKNGEVKYRDRKWRFL